MPKLLIQKIDVPEDDASNLHKVSKVLWRKWSSAQRRMYNNVFGVMTRNQSSYVHTKAPVMKPEHFTTIAHNAAFEAAYFVKELKKGN